MECLAGFELTLYHMSMICLPARGMMTFQLDQYLLYLWINSSFLYFFLSGQSPLELAEISSWSACVVLMRSQRSNCATGRLQIKLPNILTGSSTLPEC